MQFIDISTDEKSTYHLAANEQVVFFALNRTGELFFELEDENAAAHIFAFFVGHGNDKGLLRIAQHHVAPNTLSRALVKSALTGQAEFSYEGLIHIEKSAPLSDAAQESRALLLSENARAFARPSLEILAHDVQCRHAATVHPLGEEALFFAESRGLSEKEARTLLIDGFFHEAFERMETLGVQTEVIRKNFQKI